ncbi:MAG: hypothetical protein NPINA01_30790 [Nitrospinaceae bacterium]|nr:MAG: hypothetical protein NPINA01_30790 [Nitrospinaceae bacterium]
MQTHKFISLLLAGLLLTTQSAFAGHSLEHSVQGSKHASQAVAHSVVGAAKLSSGIVAVPLMAVGEVGKAAGSVGDEMWDAANTPLPISDETVTAGPPPSVPSDETVKVDLSVSAQGE